MLNFFQPAATLFIGMALFIYGLIQAITHAPPTTAFQTAVQAMPDTFAVLIFALGLAAIIAGIILLVCGFKGVRSRARDINRAYGPRNRPRRHPRDQYTYDDDWDDQAVYR